MKLKTSTSILFSLIFGLLSYSQVPQGFNYQAVARDVSGNPIANYSLPVEIIIQSDSLGGTIFWDELHSNITTNQFGLFTLTVGKGVKQTGTATTFSDIDWSVTPKFIRTRINYSGWKELGSARFNSVPYALMAKDLSGAVKKLAVTGTTTDMGEALFEVKNNTGQTVFAVYNEGVRVFVDDGNAKAAKGGFAISGFGGAKAVPQDYFVVSPDSIRAYIGTNPPAKAAKGGFSVSGFTAAKVAPEEYLRVTRDSTRVYVSEPAKGVKGGFAVGGFVGAKGNSGNYLDLTPENYLIGQDAGKGLTTGAYNSFLGYQAGYRDSTGSWNNFIGYRAGYRTNGGSNNVFLGYQAGYSNKLGTSNTFVGNNSGKNIKTGSANAFYGVSSGQEFLEGDFNTFVGSGAGLMFQKGTNNIIIGYLAAYQGNFAGVVTGPQDNVIIGTKAGSRINTGTNNVFLGNNSGYSNTQGSNNVFLGNQSGYFNGTGSDNTFMGFQSGYTNSSGNANVFIGKNSGYSNTSGSQNVFIGELSGNKNTTGSQNTFLGLESGKNNTTGGANVFLGWNAGLYNTTGFNNTFLGLGAGYSNTTAGYNTFLGFNAGLANQTGQSNLYLGANAGRSNATGTGNVALGESAGYSTLSGNYNLILGSEAGYNLTSGSNNVFIGLGAGASETSTSNKLFIENSAADYTGALIYGDFANDYLRFNASVDVFSRIHFPYNGAVLFVNNQEALWSNGTYFSWGFGTSYNYFARPVTIGNLNNPGSYMLYVQGNVGVTGSVTNPSDSRYKDNVSELNDVLSKIENIRGVGYDWKGEEYPEMEFDKTHQLGFIAQEVEPLFPELVKTDSKGYKSMDYSKMTVVLLQAVKEQQKQIEVQDDKIERLEKMILELEGKIASSR